MTIEVQPVLVADLRRCAEIEQQAFAESPLNDVLFPGGRAEDGLGSRTDDLAKELREDPTVRMFKAVDTDLEGDQAIVGWSKWNVHESGMPAAKDRVSPPSANDEAYRMMFVGLDQMRERLMGGKPCVYLHILVVDPKHQRRGVGVQMMTWGMQEAVRLGIPVYLESSVSGHRLYQKVGFKDVEERRVDFSKFGMAAPHSNWAMIWELPNKRCP
ncbi:acetyltransferase [Colletotrichum plurivorum]|uniref:Acetyltransferase n=1 Tax=Colletotrichum plurivorum TaxID=2175906 RepID=A0A8H6JSB1_9PEZI|nr:acetyltransferase [Colletotrichum plurivorum]